MLVLTQSVWCLYKMRQLIRTHCEPPEMFMHREKANCKPGNKASKETNHVDTLFLNL